MPEALLVIDIQRDYFPGGSMEVPGAEAVGLAAAGLIGRFRIRGAPIVHIRHLSIRPGAGFLLPGTEGSQIHPGVAPAAGETVLEKNFPNSFRGTGLHEHLRALGVKSLTVCGMMTQMCVDTTVRAAFDLGYSITLVHDACAARPLAFNGVEVRAAEVQAAYMAALGVFAKVLPVGEIV